MHNASVKTENNGVLHTPAEFQADGAVAVPADKYAHGHIQGSDVPGWFRENGVCSFYSLAGCNPGTDSEKMIWRR